MENGQNLGKYEDKHLYFLLFHSTHNGKLHLSPGEKY